MIYAGPLGRKTPSDFSHVTANPLDASKLVVPKPVAIGVNWYTDFDSPLELPSSTERYSYHLPEAKDVKGTVRGGHCVCLAPMGFNNAPNKHAYLERLWTFYNQLQEGACEGFGHSHGASLETGETYDAFTLYDNARRVEGTYPSGEGATNHGTVQAMQTYGLQPQTGTECQRGVNDSAAVHLVKAVQWTKDTQEVLAALGRENADAVPLLNSWGREYPMIVWLPTSTLERLLTEEGEADCTTDA